ncbi:P2 family phage major capsid protein, partial [Acinetobacter baumannii]|nr:P2 family phage major capsid protein [Acinetobacter baumannii]
MAAQKQYKKTYFSTPSSKTHEAQTGEAIGLSVNSTIAGRTDTSGNGERNPTDPTGFGVDKYE